MGIFQSKKTSEQYTKLSRLGGGRYGTVYKVERKGDRNLYALKMIDCGNKKELVMATNEARNMLKGEHLVQCLGSFQEKEGGLVRYYILMPLFDGSLAGYLELFGPLSHSGVARMMHHVTTALCTLHTAGIIHRDVKPLNIFYKSVGGGHRVVYYLGDMGLTKYQGVEGGNSSGKGTLMYMPRAQRDSGNYGYWVDIYALGITACHAGVNAGFARQVQNGLNSGEPVARLSSGIRSWLGAELGPIIDELLQPNTAVTSSDLLVLLSWVFVATHHSEVGIEAPQGEDSTLHAVLKQYEVQTGSPLDGFSVYFKGKLLPRPTWGRSLRSFGVHLLSVVHVVRRAPPPKPGRFPRSKY